MKTRQGYGINVECDNCGAEVSYSADYTYKEINYDLKQEGWQIKKDGNDWLDFCCKDCKDKYFE